MGTPLERRALRTAVEAAGAAGRLLRAHLGSVKVVHQATSHDIKLELDVRCQQRIERTLLRGFPASTVLGEEGVAGVPGAPVRWVVDPIDGTVNYTYGIPHACVSIALQVRENTPGFTGAKARGSKAGSVDGTDGFRTVAGVVYDPFCDELWTAVTGEPARLNGRRIHVSDRRRLAEAVVSLGFGKEPSALEQMLAAFGPLVHRVRKLRMMGAAALALTYVASGRFDAYVESGVRLWDIAAGGFIVECAGGEFWNRLRPDGHSYAINANNGRLRRPLSAYVPAPPD